MIIATVEPPNKGHFGNEPFVLCSEVVPISEVHYVLIKDREYIDMHECDDQMLKTVIMKKPSGSLSDLSVVNEWIDP